MARVAAQRAWPAQHAQPVDLNTGNEAISIKWGGAKAPPHVFAIAA